MYVNQADGPSRYIRRIMQEELFKMLFDKSLHPKRPIMISNPTPDDIGPNSITWFGHSFLIVKTDNITIVVDPVLNNSQFPFCFTPEYCYEPEEQLPSIEVDVAIISHNHYDHLDPKFLESLNPKLIIAPQGNLVHFTKSDREKVVELDTNESFKYGNCIFTLVPARHFSGRGLADRDRSLWGGFVIAWEGHFVYYSGDTGYSESNIQRIKELFPDRFDVAIIECGQYGEGWPDNHLFPSEFIKYASKINAVVSIPIHYGKFELSGSHWCAGVEEVYDNRHEISGTLLKTISIGEVMQLESIEEAGSTNWWNGM